jgi:hypothetical protein
MLGNQIGDFPGTFYAKGDHLCDDRRSRSSLGLFYLPAMARDGIEPPTRGFSVRCSTN